MAFAYRGYTYSDGYPTEEGLQKDAHVIIITKNANTSLIISLCLGYCRLYHEGTYDK